MVQYNKVRNTMPLSTKNPFGSSRKNKSVRLFTPVKIGSVICRHTKQGCIVKKESFSSPQEKSFSLIRFWNASKLQILVILFPRAILQVSAYIVDHFYVCCPRYHVSKLQISVSLEVDILKSLPAWNIYLSLMRMVIAVVVRILVLHEYLTEMR